MVNVISVDVEEYFHATNLDSLLGPAKWYSLPKRVELSTRKVLELLTATNTKGTFFVLGHIAQRWPKLVQEISSLGHEVASHGYGHRLAYAQNSRQFFRDVYRSRLLLEDLTGQAILGYRAPNFSITKETPWAYDDLIRAGYRYDSSLYPIWHPRYANVDANPYPHVLDRDIGRLVVFPMAVTQLNIFGKKLQLPIAGGAYWRLLPKTYISWGLRRNQQDQNGFSCCYVHPWEFDFEQPFFKELPLLTRIRHYGGVKGLEQRFISFLSTFKFVPLCEAASTIFGKDLSTIHRHN